MRCWFLVLVGVLAAWAQPVQAQVIGLDVQSVPLEDALQALSAQAKIDIVYAGRLVEDRTTTCVYEGDRVEDALLCILEDLPLQAERIRRRQYVLVSADTSGAVPGAPVPRGLLAGFITDSETGEVLPGAHVLLRDLGVGAVTNEAGYFALATLPRGEYPVHISYLGYQARDTVLATEPEPRTIQLHPTAVEADAVVVEGDASKVTDPVPGLLALPTQQLAQLPSFPGEQDLLQALQWLPGVQRTGEVNGGLVVRGGATDQNLYLLDGAPVYHPWHAFSLISTFQTETFKDVRLYRGPFPAEHGGRLSAVLDAQLKDGSGGEPGVLAALSPLSGRLMIESPITSTSSFMVAARRSYLDKLIREEHPVEEDGRRDTLRTGYYFYDWSAKVMFRPNQRHRLSVSYYQGRDDLDLRLPFDLSLDFSSWLRPADLFFEIDHNWGNRLISARHQYLYSKRLFVTTTAYRTNYEATEAAFIRPTTSSSLRSDYNVKLRDLGLKLDVDFYHSVAHQVRFGLRAVDHRFRSNLEAVIERSPGAVDVQNQESPLHAYELIGYVQDTWTPRPRWQIQPGVRATYFSGGRHVNIAPRMMLQYALRPNQVTLRGSAGMQVQYLHRLRDRYSFVYDLVSSRWVPASDQVEPSRSLQAALGIEARPMEDLTLTADVYVHQARNVLLPEDTYRTKDGLEGPGIEVGALLGQYVPARARNYGIELGTRYQQGPWLLWASYAGGRSLTRSDALEETRYRPSNYDAPRTLQGVVDYQGARWRLGVAVEARSGYPLTVPVARYALGDALDDDPVHYLHRSQINNGRLPAYFRVDVTAGYRFGWLGARWQVDLQLYNVLNRRNVVSRQYEPEPGFVRVSDRRGLPILPLIELEMKL